MLVTPGIQLGVYNSIVPPALGQQAGGVNKEGLIAHMLTFQAFPSLVLRDDERKWDSVSLAFQNTSKKILRRSPSRQLAKKPW